MKNKKRKFTIYNNKFRRTVNIIILLIGAVILSGFIALIQTNASKDKQRTNGINALNEISVTLQNNDATVENIKFEYNKLNQNTTESLSSFASQANLFAPIVNETDPAIKQNLIDEACANLVGLQEELNTDAKGEVKDTIGAIGIIDSNGDIIISNSDLYTGANLVDFGITASQISDLCKYDKDNGINGTETINGTEVTFSPVSLTTGTGEDTKDYFMYSSYLYSKDSTDYYLILDVSNSLLETELAGIDQIGNVLNTLSLGEDGFFFAIDTSTGEFVHFDHKGDLLSGHKFSEYGFEESAAIDGYTGYQKINGVKYYCVTKSSDTVTYGKYLIVCAAIDQQELISKNLLTIFVSCFSFVLVACIVSGQGMILNREIANHFILVENRVREKVSETKIERVGSFTDEEIKDRTHIQMEEIIEQKKDPILKRVNIGFRNRHGAQRCFSSYVFNNMLPIFIIGIASIFTIVFFSQTIMSVQNATTTSGIKLDGIGALIEENNDNTEKISEFVSNQYLSKNKLLGYILSNETPSEALDGAFDQNINDKDTFQLYDVVDGKKVYLFDEFGNPRLSTRYSPALVKMCEDNDLNSIYIYDDEGKAILTNKNDWLFTLSNDTNEQSYEFREIVEGKRDSVIQDYGVDEGGEYNQYIGSVFYYYTYNDAANGMTRHISEGAYQAYLHGDNTYGKIIPHRGAIQISINQKTLKNIYRIASLESILNGTTVYGSDSYFIAFDDSPEHKIVFSGNHDLHGRTAGELGISEEAFLYNSVYHGFIRINGERCYQSFKYVDGYFLATVIPMVDITYNRLNVSLYTLILSALFIFVGSVFFTISNNKTDEQYREKIRKDGKALAKPIGFIVTGPNGKKKKTMSAYARYFRVGWNRKTPEQKLSSILMIYLTIASFVILGIIVYALAENTPDSIFTYIFSNKWDKGFNLFAITEAIMIIFIIVTASKILKFVVKWFSVSLGARAETTGNLIISVLKYGGVLGTIFYALYLFGFDTGGLLTSAGVLSVVVGLGAQSLIGDILAGMFIVFESEFRVGDIVTIDDFRGQVIEIGLRTTKLVDISNNVKVFNNSVINKVLNMTKESSYAVVDVSVEYGADLERIEQVLYDGFPKIRKNLPSIIEGPFYRGVESLGESAVVLKIVANCEEKDRIQLARDLNREIFLLFKENNINIPFNQLTLSYLEDGGKKDEKNSNND